MAKSSSNLKAPAGASRAAVYTVAELGELLRLPERWVLAMLEGRESVFPGAWQEGDAVAQLAGNGWRIPARAVDRYLDRRAEPLFTYQEAADFLGVHKVTVQKAAADWLKGDRNGFETVELMLPGCGPKRNPRITLSELLRHVQAAPRTVPAPPPAAAA